MRPKNVILDLTGLPNLSGLVGQNPPVVFYAGNERIIGVSGRRTVLSDGDQF
jgi:hypothetical protein